MISKILFLISAILLSIQCFAQESILDKKITPSQTEGTIEFFLKDIESQLKTQFYYDNSKISTTKKITIKKEEKTTREYLNEILTGEKVKVILRGKNIILKKTEKESSKKAAGKATIQGYIKDAESGENLIGAHAFHFESLSGTSSNYYGFYSITLPIGTTTMGYSYVSYKNVKHTINLQNDTIININLSNELLDEVIVSAEKSVPIQETTEMGTISISSQQIKARPALGGEVDVIKVLQLMPGVQSGREGSAGLYVRGGGPDQNLILLDGVPIYNVSHLFGFMSVFNADAINKVKLTKGAFPARYGGRLSSIVDISMREGNSSEVKGEGSLGLVAAKLTIEGPIVKDKTSFIVSGRRTYADVLAGPFIKTENVDPDNANKRDISNAGYYFYDLNAKINHKFSDKDRLYLSAYTGRDKGFRDLMNIETVELSAKTVDNITDSNDDLEWGSTIGLLRWNHVLGSKIFSNLSLSYSKYDFFSENKFYEEVENISGKFTDFQNFRVSSGIEDWSALLDFDFYPNPNHYVRFGAKGIAHDFTPNIVGLRAEERTDTTFNASSIKTKEFALYFEDDVKISRKLKANIGVHASGFSVNGKFYKSIQPRVSFRYLLNDDLALKGSYTQMTQFLNLLTNPGVGLPTDFWVPATDRVKPQESTQYVLGLAYTHPTKNFEASIEGYYKSMDNLIEYKEGAGFLSLNENWQDKIETGKGRGYGVEFFISKSFGKNTDGWIGYTLSWSDRTFENINFGKTFPFKYDRRHDISAVINHKLSDKILLTANWVFGTGSTLTLPVAEFQGSPGHFNESSQFTYFYERYKDRNSFRMRAYHRGDVSISFHKKKKWGSRDWVISIYNVYSRRNAFNVEQRVVQDFSQERRPRKFKEYTLFPIIPSVSYRFKF